ncbi:MAG: transcription termination/antitermination protein NusA [Anaerolineales bacterium]|nr:transcription termination/antitermination protein NusA [Anaerolineales bacterium]
MKSEFLLAFNEICESRGLSKDVVLETIETALVSAFRRNLGVSNAQNIIAKIDPVTGMATIFAEKEVVDAVQDKRTEVTIKDAQKMGKEKVVIGDTVMMDSTPKDFGRIAAQTAKQVILQRIREAERDQLFEDYSGREGEIVNGTVQSVTPQAVTIGLGRTEALLPRNQQVPGERYYPHDKVRAYVLEVRRSSRGPQIIISRSHRNMLRRMLELEVPEIYNGLVEIKSVAREAGQRSKVAVAALQDGVDPVGACVGIRGVRIQSIVRELNDEKIDVIEWNADPRVFIAKALSPARVSQVYLHPASSSGKTATVVVADDQLSLAIGREGQNARLAAKLTGWRIDIKSLTEAAKEAITKRDHLLVAQAVAKETSLFEQVEFILEKKEAGRPITAEDFNTLNRLVEIIEGRFAEQDEEERKAEDAARRAVPGLYWQIPIVVLELSEKTANACTKHGLDTVGSIMALLSFNPIKLKERAKLNDEALSEIQHRMSTTDFPSSEEALKETLGELQGEYEPVKPVDEETIEQVDEDQKEEEELLESIEEQVPQAEILEEGIKEEELEMEPAALYEEPPPEIQIPLAEEEAEPEPEPAPVVTKEKPIKEPLIVPARREEDEFLTPSKKKSKKKKRQLVYDEDLGKVVSRRKRKRSSRDSWDDFE